MIKSIKHQLFFFCSSWLSLLVFNQTLNAQDIRFNEVVSSNISIFDEDGDTPDWLELHNYGTENIALNGWTLSDRKDQPNKWTFPNTTLNADDYLQIWASNKDKTNLSIVRTLISEGDIFRYFVPNQEVFPFWNTLQFDDTTWDEGPSGFGYNDDDDATTVPPSTPSVYIRKTFNIDNKEAIKKLLLDIDYDDAFVAYINGVEVARANIEGFPPTFNTFANVDHEANMHEGGFPDRFELADPDSFLQNGINILSIQVHNISWTSSDLSIIPFLSAFYEEETTEGMVPPEILRLSNTLLHTNFKISSSGETLFLFNPNENLIDSIVIENLQANTSLGWPLGGSELVIFDSLTPGLPNPTNGFSGINLPNIIFSHQGGSTNPLSLTLSGTSSDEQIRYTLDATIPNENSPIYNNAISINQNTVVRARIFRQGTLPSPIQSRTYLVNTSHQLPIVSLVTEPDNFFSDETGIYVLGDDYVGDFPYFGSNIWEEWERPIHFSFYEPDGNLGIAFNAGTKIFGNYSRGNDQRSLSIFARKQYGIDEINYPFFPNLDYDSFQAIILRNSGNDWLSTNMRDAVLTGLMKNSGLDFQAYRPTATYINGDYWGILNMREKVNEHFLAIKYNIDPDDIDIISGNGELVHGDDQNYWALINFLENNQLTSEANYQTVSDQIDIKNYIKYQVAQIYFNNTDWPGNNIKCWREKNKKWRWILYDTDFGFGIWNDNDFQNNTLNFALTSINEPWPNPAWSTLLFRRLAQNLSFRNQFVNQFADELNSRFLPLNVINHIDVINAGIASEINAHYNRWEGSTFYRNSKVNGMKNFASERPNFMKIYIRSTFDLSDFHQLTFENQSTNRGYVQVNSLTIKNSLWRGDYFQDVPIKVSAIPKPGFTFSHWTGAISSTDFELEIDMQTAMTLVPHFEPLAIGDQDIIINEINYHSGENINTEEWIELHNKNENLVNLSGWTIKDNDDTHTFELPEGTLIPGNSYLVITENGTKFRAAYPDINFITGDFDFDLSNEGDQVRLFNRAMELQDDVQYLSVAPWPEEANGQGPTLELIHPDLDNALAENWATVHEFGSPGETNIEVISSIYLSENTMGELNYFPNPFSDQINIIFTLTEASRIKGTLYNTSGIQVASIIDQSFSAGSHHIEKRLKHLAPGVYWLELSEGKENVVNIKWVKI